MRMTERLRVIAGMVPTCDALYDIGTDHGRLPAFLLKEGRCRHIFACDISQSSLNKAISLFDKMGLNGQFVCTDGLTGLHPEEGDCVAICGMGARTMLGILRDGLPCPLVLSTHVDVELLRAELPARGYRIVRERLVREDRRFYSVMHVAAGQDVPCSGADAYIGRCLKGDPLLGVYIAWREGVARKAALGGDPEWEEKLGWIEEGKQWLKES